jgi:uncharacterized protein
MPVTTALPDWFARAQEALHAGDVDGWMAMYAPDAVHEFPFAPADRVRRLAGRDAIAAYMSQLPGRIRFGTLSDVRVHEAGDTTVIEAVGHHFRVADDSPRDLGYIWVITRENGQVTLFRDYLNASQRPAR